jgi:CBS domain-containing protein
MEMTSKRLGATAVTDHVGQVIGIITDGDLRRSINTLQTCSSFVKTPGDGGSRKLTKADIEKISGIVPDSVI